MAAFQFAHMELYARSASKKAGEAAKKAGGKTHNVASIAAELRRDEGSCPHVKAPQPPALLEGTLDIEAVSRERC